MELPLPINRSKQILLYYVGNNEKNLSRSKNYHKKYDTKLSSILNALRHKIKLLLAIPVVEINYDGDQEYYRLQHPGQTLLFYTIDGCKHYLNEIVKTNEVYIQLVEHHRRLHESTVSSNAREKYDKLAQHLLDNEYLIEFVEEVYFEEYGELPDILYQRTFLQKVMRAKAKPKPNLVCLERGALVEAYDKESNMWWPYMVLTSNGRRGNRYMNYTSMCLYPRYPKCSFWQGRVEEKNLHLGPFKEDGKLVIGSWRTIDDRVLNEADIDKIQQRVLCNQKMPPETFDDILGIKV